MRFSLSSLRFALLVLPVMCVASSSIVACSGALEEEGGTSADEVNTRPVIPGDDDGSAYGYYGGGYGYGGYGYGYGRP